MAYRRKDNEIYDDDQQPQLHRHDEDEDEDEDEDDGGSGCLAAHAIRASAAHRDSSAYAYAYAYDASPPLSSSSSPLPPPPPYDASPPLSSSPPSSSSPLPPPSYYIPTKEGHTGARHKTAHTLQETPKIQITRRGGNTDTQDQATVIHNTSWQCPVLQPVLTNSLDNQETQLKASRDVAMATAAKAKVLIRELKTAKADLAFAKERCSQLEAENKQLRENWVKGDNTAADDLILLQLETLIGEKARLGHENSIYARENRFLREIVEYHQLRKQDAVHLDDSGDQVADAYTLYIDDDDDDDVDDDDDDDDDKMVCMSPTYFKQMSSKECPARDEKTTSKVGEYRETIQEEEGESWRNNGIPSFN